MSVLFSTAIDIDAPASQVWAVLTDFPSYGEWSNFSKVDGVARVDDTLSMRMPGFAFSARVMVARPNEELIWAAKLFSRSVFYGQHRFTLKSNHDGTTRVTNT